MGDAQSGLGHFTLARWEILGHGNQQRLCDAKTGEILTQFADFASFQPWSPDNRFATVDRIGVSIFDPTSGKSPTQLKVETRIKADNPLHLAWGPKGEHIVTDTKNGMLYLWKLGKAEPLHAFRLESTGMYPRIFWSKDGDTLFYGTNNWLYAFDLKTGKRGSTLVLMPNDQHAVIGANGNINASTKAMREVRFIVQKSGRQTTYTAEDFLATFNWQNDQRVSLSGR